MLEDQPCGSATHLVGAVGRGLEEVPFRRRRRCPCRKEIVNQAIEAREERARIIIPPLRFRRNSITISVLAVGSRDCLGICWRRVLARRRTWPPVGQ
eukprot:5233852-Pyramimonas_sp.AAC.1